ncbi:diguanylate cyclase [Vibrio astriarenae]|uniref:diguanylate cyclase n=1 Tax=Vibrio astriarenae TaxID=1481923 RepID=A0A7Z2YFJ5_9VIBR|nr:diguanylate cyclase [Vibrio astriarenae]QIA65254.1 diguanylate cyclase [Vibrio astriarenae]
MMENNASMRILLVDDVQLDRMQLAIRLKQQGHNVEAVSGGREALEVFYDFDPELVLLDITMPEMDGFEVAQRIREQDDDWRPIIFLSSHEEPHFISKAIDAGGDDYLIKPVDRVVLTAKLTAMQRIAMMRRELQSTSSELERVNYRLMKQVNEDGLTKLFNRRFMDEQLQKIVNFHGRHEIPFSLILFDVDHFKPYNDNYGHIEGDKCLIKISNAINNLFTRTEEYVGRYGGEEFVVLLANTDLDKLEQACGRIHKAIVELNIENSGSLVSDIVTVSQGGITFIPHGNESVDSLYEQADKLLYQAKKNGRASYVIETIDP